MQTARAQFKILSFELWSVGIHIHPHGRTLESPLAADGVLHDVEEQWYSPAFQQELPHRRGSTAPVHEHGCRSDDFQAARAGR